MSNIINLQKDYGEISTQEYLELLQSQILNVYNQMVALDYLMGYDSDHNIDINDFISTAYPFPMSFDEFTSEVGYWADTVQDTIYDYLEGN